MLDAASRDNFAARLKSLVKIDVDQSRKIPRNLCKLGTNAEPRYQIGDKIVYGSDWLVSTEADRADFACSFDMFFSRTDLKD